MERLSAADASFLQFETGSAPMQLGALHLFDGRGADPAPAFRRFRAHVKERLHLWPRLRQRIVRVPLNLDHPYWLDDPEFFLDHHLSRVSLPAPRNRQSLLDMAGAIISRPLDKSRPLWDIVYVEGVSRLAGLGPGSFALIGRVHQSMVSAVGGGDWVLRVSGSCPSPEPLVPKPWRPEPVPSDAQMLAKAYGRAMSSPVELARLVARGAMVGAQIVQAGTVRDGQLPPPLFAAPTTGWNTSITPARAISMTAVPLERLARIRRRAKGSHLNDVIAAVCAGALRSLLIDQGQLPDQSLIALSPVLVRDQRGKMTAVPLLLPLGTEMADPVMRLEAIGKIAMDSGIYERGCPLEEIADVAPLMLTVEAVRLYSGIHMADRFRPLFNLLCSYVPSPPQQRYLLGAALHTRAFVLPLLDGQGLTITAIGCAEHLTIVTMGCPDRIQGLEEFGSHIDRSVRELESALKSR